MTAPDATLQDDARYRALQAKDARFDGCFFTGVTSTGIYCRPVCRVRTPRRENCRFFSHAAQAEQAGFRPCLRCRPELAPRAGAGIGQPTPQEGVWSIQDASRMLALQAARLLDSPEAWPDSAPSVQSLATRLGISARHLRRIFEAQWGVAPLHYLQTRRLLCAKQLLTDTALAVSQVAALSGFASTRRFNAVFSAHYALAPTQLRRGSAPNRRPLAPGIHLQLAYRPPYDVAAMLQFFASRQIAGLEIVNPNGERPFIGKTLTVTAGQQQHNGWLLARFDPPRHRVELQVSDSLQAVLPVVLARVRALLDLDADPQAINALLDPHFPLGGGLRVPGTLDGFELAVRAVLGQQISVAAARTLAERLVARFGQPLTSPVAGLDRLFPTPAALASASADALGQIGIVKQRQAAIQAIARAITQQQLFLHAGADVAATVSALTALPGIGDWTAQYIAMRALRWPDAFPAGDVALHKALGLQDTKRPAQAAQAAALAWQPWRSYAVIRAWALLPLAVKKRQVTQHATK